MGSNKQRWDEVAGYTEDEIRQACRIMARNTSMSEREAYLQCWDYQVIPESVLEEMARENRQKMTKPTVETWGAVTVSYGHMFGQPVVALGRVDDVGSGIVLTMEEWPEFLRCAVKEVTRINNEILPDLMLPCQPIGCDNGQHLPGCSYAKIDGMS